MMKNFYLRNLYFAALAFMAVDLLNATENTETAIVCPLSFNERNQFITLRHTDGSDQESVSLLQNEYARTLDQVVLPQLDINQRICLMEKLHEIGLISGEKLNEEETYFSDSLMPFWSSSCDAEFVFDIALGSLVVGVKESICEKYANKKDHEKLNYLLNQLGWTDGQCYVSQGYAMGEYGFSQNPEELRRLADLGWTEAQWFVSEGYATGEYGLTQTPGELRRLADLGWTDAQWFVSRGYAKGEYGFSLDHEELKRLAFDLGWPDAKKNVCTGISYGFRGFTRNIEELKRLAFNLGWPEAQDSLCWGYAKGEYGLSQNPEELKRLAFNLGWKDAQWFVSQGYAQGEYGFPQNPAELLRLASLGWKYAQFRVIEGYAEGKFGFTLKDPALYDFAEKHCQNDYVSRVALTTLEKPEGQMHFALVIGGAIKSKT